jgi:hypothetical protein
MTEIHTDKQASTPTAMSEDTGDVAKGACYSPSVMS